MVVSRPSIIHHVLKSGEGAFAKSDIQTRYMQQFLGKGLLTFHGEPWRRQRRVIAEGFAPRRLAALIAPMAAAVEAQLNELDRAGRSTPADIAPDMHRMTFTLVARSLMGAVISESDIATISHAIERVQAYLVRCIVLPWASGLHRLSGAEERHQRLRRGGDAVVARQVDARLAQGRGDEGDMLDLLMAAAHPDGGAALGREELVCEIMQLLVAGHETSSGVLGWTLWLLAAHPAALARAMAEVEASPRATMADFYQMTWCIAAIKEAMRLYPPFWLIDRVAIADSQVDGITIPAGLRIALFVQGVHRRADLWHEPDAFRPERFLGDEARHERDGAYIPFGSGPRTCVGSQFAMLQMLTILAAMLRRYDIAPAARPPRARAQLTLRAGNGIWLNLRKRA